MLAIKFFTRKRLYMFIVNLLVLEIIASFVLSCGQKYQEHQIFCVFRKRIVGRYFCIEIKMLVMKFSTRKLLHVHIVNLLVFEIFATILKVVVKDAESIFFLFFSEMDNLVSFLHRNKNVGHRILYKNGSIHVYRKSPGF